MRPLLSIRLVLSAAKGEWPRPLYSTSPHSTGSQVSLPPHLPHWLSANVFCRVELIFSHRKKPWRISQVPIDSKHKIPYTQIHTDARTAMWLSEHFVTLVLYTALSARQIFGWLCDTACIHSPSICSGCRGVECVERPITRPACQLVPGQWAGVKSVCVLLSCKSMCVRTGLVLLFQYESGAVVFFFW